MFYRKRIADLGFGLMSEGWSSCYEASADSTIDEFLLKRWYRLVFYLLELADVPFSRGTRVLEVGCGRGGFCVFASSVGAEVVGLDLAKPALRSAGKTGLGFFLLADACSLPFERGQFDVVVCADVLEHVNCYERAFAEISRVCKKGGYLVFTTPTRTNITQIFAPFFLFRKRFGMSESQPADVNSFSLPKLKLLCEQNNLKVLFERGIGIFWVPTRSRRIAMLLGRLEKPVSKFRNLCINIGVIAQKSGNIG